MNELHPVRRLRALRGIRFTELARRAELSPSALAAIEQGSTSMPSESTVAALAGVLNVTPASLKRAITQWREGRPRPEMDLPLPGRFRTFVDWRVATGLSQTGFARAIGVSHGTVNLYERGLRKSFSTAIGIGLMRRYGVDAAFVDALASLPATNEQEG